MPNKSLKQQDWSNWDSNVPERPFPLSGVQAPDGPAFQGRAAAPGAAWREVERRSSEGERFN